MWSGIRGPQMITAPLPLARRLSDWVSSSIDGFTPWNQEGTINSATLKRFAELCIAYDVIVSSPLSLPSAEACWSAFIRTQVSDPAFGELARSRLDSAWSILLPYLILRRHGFRDDYHEATLAYAVQAGFPSAAEVVPHRMLDIAYFAQRAGYRPPARPTWRGLLNRTFAAQARCRYLVTGDSIYSLTHTVFYCSGFGQALVRGDRLAQAAPIVDSLIIACCAEKDYDLLGELLICSVVLKDCKPLVRDLGLPAFLTTLDDSGCLLANGRMNERTFANCYHTTLVGLILCACLARHMS